MSYNELLNKLYEYYGELYQKDKTLGLLLPLKRIDNIKTYIKPPIELFEGLLNDDSFCEKIGIDYYKRDLTYKERYDIWFKNNYETGMEYSDSIEIDFKNSYYEYTPKELVTIQFDKKNHTCYK